MLTLALYHHEKKLNNKKIILLFSSYFFYASWDLVYVLLLFFSTVIDWVASSYIKKNGSNKKLFIISSVVINLLLLGYFKYTEFITTSIYTVLQLSSLNIQNSPLQEILLPIGISFYTFQSMSYSVDNYRGKAIVPHSFLDFMVYVSFFPQLVAGPIIRADVFLKQLIKQPIINPQKIEIGLFMIVLGMFQKTFLADTLLAPIVEKIFDVNHVVGTLEIWTAAFAFSGQIFFDFSGYSLVAIGIAKLFGFSFPDNFLFPYAARGFSDFWRRWHISLSSWIRDYVYISLSGNRSGKVRTAFNLLITMFLAGLWHGAAWTFVLWGLLHAFFLIAEFNLKKLVRIEFNLGKCIITFTLVSFSWILFRANELEQAFVFMKTMTFSIVGSNTLGFTDYFITLIVIGGLFITHWNLRDTRFGDIYNKISSLRKVVLVIIMLTSSIVLTGNSRAFIYFQF